MKTPALLSFLVMSLFLLSCKKDKNETNPNNPPADVPELIFVFQFDSTQERLGNFGQPVSIPAGNAGQSPVFHKMAGHYIELAPDSLTWLGTGKVVYMGSSYMTAADTGIDFDLESRVGNNEEFYRIPLSQVGAGTFNWLRVSLAYQEYDISVRISSPPNDYDFITRVASFIGYNTYIRNYQLADTTITVNDFKKQGYWGLRVNSPLIKAFSSGDASNTTVPNPIAATSPVPAGSCVVTGKFQQPLVLTGNETSDIKVIVSISTNKSFEWKDVNGNGLFEPEIGDSVVDMGVRGMKVWKD
jgi:hypothetical protein